jgi:hypothetical protein
VRLRISKHAVGTVLSVAAAVVMTAQAMNAPPKPYKARDIVPASPAAFAAVCAMYPAECRFNADGSVARVIGRRIVPGSHSEILNHFRAATGVVPTQLWEVQQ